MPQLGKPSPAEYLQYTPKAKRWKAYCGIDVGSISCGYAFSFRDTDHIWDNDNWTDKYCYFSQKAPSALLYDSNKVPVAFGFEACEKYMLLSPEEAAQVTFVYDGLLHHGETIVEREQKNLESSSEKADASAGTDDYIEQIREAVLVHYANVALLLGRHCKQNIEETYKSLRRTPHEMVWCFVVPLAWDADCKSYYVKKIKELYLREYSEEFAAQRYQIKVVTSTEAMWFSQREDMRKKLKWDKFSIRKDKSVKEKAAIFVQSGATKTEISVHKKKSGRIPVDTTTLEAGGHCSNKIFEELMKECLDPQGSFLSELKNHFTSAWLEMLLTFENAKSSIIQNDLSLDIFYRLSEAWYKVSGKEIEETLGKTETGRQSASLSKTGKLQPNVQRLQKVNTDSAEAITSAVKELVKSNNVEVIAIILAGGFGASAFVKDSFVKEQRNQLLPPTMLKTPHNSAMLLARGAVISGKDENYKKIPNTFVVHWYHNADEWVGDKAKGLKIMNGQRILEKVYPIVYKGDDIEVGRSFHIGPFHMNKFYREHVWFDIYKIPRNMDALKDPTNTYYNGECIAEDEKIGKLRITVPAVDYDKPCMVYIDVSLDLLGFKATMVLSSSPGAEKSSAVCRYM